MDDSKIIDLYWERSESAISETSAKYSQYCNYISYNILYNREDAEECVNDTYLHAWNAMPPKRPDRLSTFLGKITRNLSLDRFRMYSAKKRRLSQTILALEELNECISSKESVEQTTDEIILVEAINNYLLSLSDEKRKVFVRRYWYLSMISDISTEYEMSESKVKSILARARHGLKEHLEKEGVIL
jgi:RNA polymerase sigma-70 factor (ECF subfamily)